MEKQIKPKKLNIKFNKKFWQNLAVLLLVFVGGIWLGRSDVNLPGNFANQSSQNQDLPKQLDYRGVEEVYSQLKSGFDGQLDVNKLQNGLKSGLVEAAGDPYTEFLNEADTKELEEDLSGSFEGIGAELGKDKEAIVIVAPITGFPAEKAGLKPKDVVAEIDGETTSDLSLTEAVKKIRGPKGTKVKLVIIRDNKRLDFEITRDQINIPSVTSEVVGTTGIITISRFGNDTAELTDKFARELKAKNVKSVILDVRGNPGGRLDAAVDVAGLWLNKGSTILQEKRGGQVIKTYFAENKPVLNGLPTVVLIDEGSASASEIVAGALKDNNVATLIGQKSYGKGSVQEIRSLTFGGSLKVTVARWFTPNGRNIDKEGIEPDQKVEITDADAASNRDPQRDAAIQKLAL